MTGMAKTPVRADVAQRLKEARSRIFSTAAEAAEALNMKAVTLRAHENAQNGVNIYDLERYARRYGVNIQWLLTGAGPERPDATHHVELGEMLAVRWDIEPGAWIPEDDPSRRRRPNPPGDELQEVVPFTDPRFPADMVEAVRLGKCSPLAHYITGTILFIVEVAEFGYRNGDHVIVYRERGDFVNVSVRRVIAEEPGNVVFRSLTDPDEPDLKWEETEKEGLPHVTAVVVGSLTRRPVREPDLETLRRFEEYERSRRFTPKDWRRMTKEAQAIVSGKKAPGGDADAFQSVEEAQQFLDLNFDTTDNSEPA